MKDNISPEEKLLKLIKGQKSKELPKPVVSVEKPADKPAAFDPKLDSFRKYFLFLSTNRIIMLIFILSCIYLIISFIYPFWGLKRIDLGPEVIKLKPENIPIKPKQEVKPFESYLDSVKKQKIFSSGISGDDTSKPAKAASADLIKDINLVGIISGENPQVIIEDKKAQKTYYLNKGQFIGDIEVSDIQEGKIILNYNGQKYELYL